MSSVLANFIPSPPPTVDTYIKSDGSVVPSDAPICRVGDTYVLTADLVNHTLTVERDNIVIDGGGFTLNKDGITHELHLIDRRNVTILNMNIGGVYLHWSSNIVIAKNSISVVTLDSSSYNEITGNSVETIEVNSGSDYNLIVRNKVISMVNLEGGNYTTVSENNFINCLASVFVYSCHNVISKNNVVNEKNSGTLIITSEGSYNKVFGNNITTSDATGVAITEGCNNAVYENNLVNCSIGVSLGSSDKRRVIANNTVYHNNFLNNTYDVCMGCVESSNFFDNGSEGNYWSRYSGADDNGDGIGDLEYVVYENFDKYPLMNRYVQSTDLAPITLVFPENCTYNTANVSVGYASNETLKWTAYRLDNKDYVEIQPTKTNTTISDLSNGLHKLTVYAKDSAGNIISSKTVYFTVDVESPILNTVGTILVIGAGTAILLYLIAKKRKHHPPELHETAAT
jgi:hypothetical protein